MLISFSSSSAPRSLRRQSGFTLVEIITVLAIIGMLIGVVISNTDKIFGDSQISVARMYVRDSLKTPLVRYRIDMGDYPSTNEGLAALLNAPGSNADRWHGPYMDSTGGKEPRDPWGEPFQYRYPGTKNSGSYDVFSKGPDKAAETADDIGNW